MSAREKTRSTGGSSVVYRTASHVVCEGCGEGAVVGDENENVNKCSCCGMTYGGRP